MKPSRITRPLTFVVVVFLIGLGACTQSDQKTSPDDSSGNVEKQKPQASHSNYCPPSPTYPQDCQDVCGEFKIELETQLKDPKCSNCLEIAFAFDDCNDQITRYYNDGELCTGETGPLVTPQCKCCGDSQDLVCSRPRIWFRSFAHFIAHNPNTYKYKTYNKDLVGEYVDNNGDTNYTDCCNGDGYYVEYEPSTKTVHVGCL